MPGRLLHIRMGRHPHEIGVLVVSVIVGLVGVLIPEEMSRAVAYVLDGWVIRFFYAGLGLFAGIALFGCLRRQIEGLLLERVGLTMLALYYGVYAYCAVSALSTVLGALLPVAYGVASLWRVYQIRTDLALLKSYLADHPGEEIP